MTYETSLKLIVLNIHITGNGNFVSLLN